jgi:hypothetical protein
VMNDVASPNSATNAPVARSNANGDDAATSVGAAYGGDAPWWRSLKVPRVSLHDIPVWGLKVSKVRRREAPRARRPIHDDFPLELPRATRRERVTD